MERARFDRLKVEIKSPLMTEAATSDDVRTAPIALWRRAGELVRTIFGLFGEPQDVAAQHTLTAQAFKLALSWIRVAEALVRQLLLIEAAALPRINAAPPRRVRKRQRRLVEHDAAAPEMWRVSFRCAPPRQAIRRSRARRAPTAPKRFYSAWPLAERCEALLRAYNDPAPYARRLARRLYARPQLSARLRIEPAHFEARVDRDVCVDLRSHAGRAADGFFSSS